MPQVNPVDVLTKWSKDVGLKFNPDGNVLKGVVASDIADFDDLLPIEAVLDLIKLTRDKSSFLSAIQVLPVSAQKGNAPVFDWTKPTLFPAKENKGAEKFTEPDTSKFPFSTTGVRSDLVITRQTMKSWRTMKVNNAEDFIRDAWVQQTRNDLVDLIVNGDETLAANPATDREYSRSVNDGLLKLIKTGTNYVDVEGALFDKKAYSKLRQLMDENYRSTEGQRWIQNPAVLDAWQDQIGHITTTGSIDGLTAQALTQNRITAPFGVSPLHVDQISTSMGPNALADGASAQSGFTRLTVNTVFGGYSAAHAGRPVKVVYLPTGEAREGYVSDSGSALLFDANDYYGQQAADTSANNYRVYITDATTVILTNPMNIAMCVWDEWRVYSEIQGNYDGRLIIHTFFDFDTILLIKKAIAVIEGMRLPVVDYP